MIDADPRHTVDTTNPEDGGHVCLEVAEFLPINPPIKHGGPEAEGGDKNPDTKVRQGHGDEEVAVDTRDHVGPEEHQQNQHVSGDDGKGHHHDNKGLKGERHDDLQMT